MSEANGHREQLEHRAAEVRSRLERRLDLIEERRHRVVEVARAATRPPASIVLVAAAAGVAAALFFVQRSRARRRQALRFSHWLAPATAPHEKSFLVQGLEKAAMSLVALTVQRLGRRSLDQLLSEPPRSAGVR